MSTETTTTELLDTRRALYDQGPNGDPGRMASIRDVEVELRRRNEVPCGYCNAPSPFGMCGRCSQGLARHGF